MYGDHVTAVTSTHGKYSFHTSYQIQLIIPDDNCTFYIYVKSLHNKQEDTVTNSNKEIQFPSKTEIQLRA